MNTRFFIAICGALAIGVIACSTQTPPSTPALIPDRQGTTRIFADNRVSGPVDLRQIHVSIDGQDAGGLSGNELAKRRDSMLVATRKLSEGLHTLTIQAQAKERLSSRMFVLSASQVFHVGREPVALSIRIGNVRGRSEEPRLDIDFAAQGGTLQGAERPTQLSDSCHALLPEATDVCETEAMLREAIAEHDAPRVVCIDDQLTRMRQLMKFHRPELHPSRSPFASRHEQAVGRDISFRIAQLVDRARRCPSAAASSTFSETECIFSTN